jgi:ring-1,2-phenylacetyl-CoA epoxidase subunit PaaC
MSNHLVQYICGIADNSLILGQRLGELCGHGPSLETDIALTNISLDLFGQVRSYFQYAAELQGEQSTEDTFAFLRKEQEYRNVLLVEQPNTDFAYVIGRQFLFDVYHQLFLEQLQSSSDQTLAAIAKKSLKEVTYHVRFSSDWVIRLGDGTEDSHNRISSAIADLWIFTEELFSATEVENEMSKNSIGVDVSALRDTYFQRVKDVLNEATIAIPDVKYFQKGGKQGNHTEHMGYILTEMQYMQRTFPNMTW